MDDLSNIPVGALVRLREGAIAKVVAPSEDGHWIRLSYVSGIDDPRDRWGEDLCAAQEVLEVVETKEQR